MLITLEEAVFYLEDGVEIVLECNGYSYEIGASENWAGGDVEEGYISLALGNVVYQDAKSVIQKSINHLSEDGHEVTITLQ